MSLLNIPMDWFVDPISKERLKCNLENLSSSSCSYSKVGTGTFWDFRPDRSSLQDIAVWEIWDELQKNGNISYQNDPANNLGVGKRDDFIEFSKFCGSYGHVLDVGCGPQRYPTHMKYCSNSDVHFIGIDPLGEDQIRDFAFVLGIAEYLPFRAGLFDQVLFVTTLDHFIDPLSALQEAKRVVKEKGEICVWLGEKKSGIPKPQKTNEWYEKLKIPKGAEDKFHFRRFSTSMFEAFCCQLELKVKNQKTIQVDPWRKNLFYKLSR